MLAASAAGTGATGAVLLPCCRVVNPAAFFGMSLPVLLSSRCGHVVSGAGASPRALLLSCCGSLAGLLPLC